jgi:hypothetical protein
MSAIHRGRLQSATARFFAFSTSSLGPELINRWQGVFWGSMGAEIAKRKARHSSHFYPIQGKLPEPSGHCFSAKVFELDARFVRLKGEQAVWGSSSILFLANSRIAGAGECQRTGLEGDSLYAF